MSLASNISDLATRIATEFKAVRILISGSGNGDTSGLDTTATNLVEAINEVLAGSSGAPPSASDTVERKSVVEGKSVSVRVDLGGSRTIQKNKKINIINKT